MWRWLLFRWNGACKTITITQDSISKALEESVALYNRTCPWLCESSCCSNTADGLKSLQTLAEKGLDNRFCVQFSPSISILPSLPTAQVTRWGGQKPGTGAPFGFLGNSEDLAQILQTETFVYQASFIPNPDWTFLINMQYGAAWLRAFSIFPPKSNTQMPKLALSWYRTWSCWFVTFLGGIWVHKPDHQILGLSWPNKHFQMNGPIFRLSNRSILIFKRFWALTTPVLWALKLLGTSGRSSWYY